MRLLISSCAAMAVAAAFAAPASAQQQPCSQPALTLTGPATGVAGTFVPVKVTETLGWYRATPDYSITATGLKSGRAYWADRGVGPRYPATNTHLIKMTDAEGGAQLAVSWTQESEPGGPGYTTEMLSCSLTKTISLVKGSGPEIKIVDAGLGTSLEEGSAQVRIGPAPCQSRAPEPVTVTLRGGGRTRSFTLADPCGRWSRTAATLPGLRVEAKAARAASSGITAQPARIVLRYGTKQRVNRVQVRHGGKVVTSRWLRTIYSAPSTRRIWQGTDDFVNVCINETLRLWSEGGRLYCEQDFPGYGDIAISKSRPKRR